MDELKECFLDPWTLTLKRFLEQYGGCNSVVGYRVLLHIAADVLMATTRTESLHASLRRRLKLHGCQTNALDLETIALLWVIMRGRRRSDYDRLEDVLGHSSGSPLFVRPFRRP